MASQPAGALEDLRPVRSPLAVFGIAWSRRALIRRLARREVELRYRGSLLGVLWSLLIPLVMLGVYWFVFTQVFRSRWAGAAEGGPPVALVLFIGLILFNLFAECVNRAPGLMLENPNYIKKVVFPLEVLPWVMLGAAVFNALVSMFVLMVGYVLLIGVPPPTALLLPLMLVPLVLFTLGVSWFLSSLGVYLRDIRQFVPVLVTMLMFLSPIFYPRDAIPPTLRPIMDFSPLAASVEEARAVLFTGRLPDWGLLALHTGVGWAVAWLGLLWFTKTRKGFADVL